MASFGIFFFIMAIAWPIGARLVFARDASVKDLVKIGLLFGAFGCLFLYGYLYARKYSVTVTKEKIELKTLFRHVTVNLCDIKEYNFKRYMRSVFYQFHISYLDKKVLINTRYWKELDELLKAQIKTNEEQGTDNEFHRNEDDDNK